MDLALLLFVTAVILSHVVAEVIGDGDADLTGNLLLLNLADAGSIASALKPVPPKTSLDIALAYRRG